MSSYYTTAQLEAMRKEKLRAQLQESIDQIRSQLQQEHRNDVKMNTASNTEITVVNEDEGISGFVSHVQIGEAVRREQSQSARRVLDLSSLLREKHSSVSRLERELEALIDTVDVRAVLTEQDAIDKDRLLYEISCTLNDRSMDIEDKLKHLGMRIESYVQGGTPASQVDPLALETEYYNYCALCSILGQTPTETLPARVSDATKRLMRAAEKQKQDEYIMDTVEEIMSSLGCSVKERAVLDHTEGQLFTLDGQALCDVFVGADGSGIMFEPVTATTDGSLDYKRRLEADANRLCSMYDRLEELALEKGVVLKRVYAEAASIGTMCSQRDLSLSQKSRQRNKAKAYRPKARTMEE